MTSLRPAASPRLVALVAVAWASAVLLAFSPGAALAQPAAAPQLLLERCFGLPRAELREALESELAALFPPPLPLTVTAICDDAVSATIRVSIRDPLATSPRVAQRILALGEVATELRPRLLALVAAELAGSLSSSPQPLEPPAPPRAPAPPLASAPSGAAPAPSPAAPARSAPPPAASASPSAAAVPPLRRRGVRLDVRAGSRFYTETPHPLFQLGVGLELPSLSIGVIGAVGSGLNPQVPAERYLPSDAGRFHPYLLGVEVRRQLDCLVTGQSTLCLNARLEGGMADVYAARRQDVLHVYSARSPYGLAALAIEARRALSRSEAGLWLELGLASGVVVYAFDEKVTSFDGVVAAFNFTLRWPR